MKEDGGWYGKASFANKSFACFAKSFLVINDTYVACVTVAIWFVFCVFVFWTAGPCFAVYFSIFYAWNSMHIVPFQYN